MPWPTANASVRNCRNAVRAGAAWPRWITAKSKKKLRVADAPSATRIRLWQSWLLAELNFQIHLDGRQLGDGQDLGSQLLAFLRTRCHQRDLQPVRALLLEIDVPSLP